MKLVLTVSLFGIILAMRILDSSDVNPMYGRMLSTHGPQGTSQN